MPIHIISKKNQFSNRNIFSNHGWLRLSAMCFTGISGISLNLFLAKLFLAYMSCSWASPTRICRKNVRYLKWTKQKGWLYNVDHFSLYLVGFWTTTVNIFFLPNTSKHNKTLSKKKKIWFQKSTCYVIPKSATPKRQLPALPWSSH